MDSRKNIHINYDDKFIQSIQTLPEVKSIESLSISHSWRHQMTQQNSDALAHVLMQMSAIKKLSLTKVHLANPHLLAVALANNTTLESIEIGTLGSTGLAKVLNAIRLSRAPIRSLSLPNCVITNCAARNALNNLIRTRVCRQLTPLPSSRGLSAGSS